MSQGPSYFANSPVSGTEYFAPMGYGCIPNGSTTVSVTVKAWSGANGTGSLVVVTTLLADVWDQTSGTSKNTFSGNFNSVTASFSGPNGTDWYKPAGKFTGVQSVGSLEIFITYTGAAFVPTTPTFSPSTGAPGSSVTVTGTHFTDATSVTFNGTSASFSITNDTTIVATVPNGATTGPIAAGNPSGSAASAGNFTPGSVFASDGATEQVVTIYVCDGAAYQLCSVYVSDGAAYQQVA